MMCEMYVDLLMLVMILVDVYNYLVKGEIEWVDIE